MLGDSVEVSNDRLSPEELKELALSVRAQKNKSIEKVVIDSATVDKHVAEIIEYMHAAAHEGEMEFEYAFEDNPKELMEAVANEIRGIYPQNLMMIMNKGKNSLTLNFSGNNHV